MQGGGPFGLPSGAWTDDTAMAACLAESLLATGGFDPEDQLRRYLRWYRTGHLWQAPLHEAIDAVAAGSFLRQQPPEIRGGGFVVASLEAALLAFANGTDYRDAVLAAANLGDDADATAAIAGQIAGAHYGLAEVPAEWRERLAHGARLAVLADGLAALAQPSPTP
jgi:ADP-ribosylglycohydrolase